MKWVKNKKIILSITTLAFLVIGCNKYPDPPMVYETEPEIKIKLDRKVLLISVDGLAGTELGKYVPENLSNILKHSKYSLSGFTVEDTGDAATWTSLMSGTSTGVHGIHGNDFDQEFDEDDPHGNDNTSGAVGYTTAFQRIMESGQKLKTYAVTSWDLLAKNINGLADVRYEVTDDLVAKDSLIAQLKREVKREGFYLINLRSLNEAGSAGGFSMENAEYKSTLNILDGYIGEMLSAIETRSSYDKEDWLIVITSNHGGIDNKYGGASFEERKVPIIFYNKKFESLEWKVSNLGQFAQLSGAWSTPVRAVIPAEKATKFNFGTSGEYTVQLKINLKSRGATWPGFFGKKKSTNNANAEPGWSFMFYDPADEPKWRPHIGHQTAGNVNQLSNRGVKMGEWTTLTMKIYEEGGKRYAQCFTDSDKHNNLEITDRNLNNNEPLILGGLAGWISNTATFDVSDIRIYNVALPDEYIMNNYCKSDINSDDQYYSNLLGYWPVKEGSGSILEDKVGDADFVFERPTLWSIASANFCNVPLDETAQKREVLVNIVDILPNIYYWLNITPHTSWKLAGTVLLNKYEPEFLKD